MNQNELEKLQTDFASNENIGVIIVSKEFDEDSILPVQEVFESCELKVVNRIAPKFADVVYYHVEHPNINNKRAMFLTGIFSSTDLGNNKREVKCVFKDETKTIISEGLICIDLEDFSGFYLEHY